MLNDRVKRAATSDVPTSGNETSTSSSRRRWSRRPVFITLALGFSFLVFLSLDLIIGSLLPVAPQRSFRTKHAFYHHALAPHQTRVTNWGSRSYEMITNSLGFRDRDPRNISLKTDRPRVILIGDSMIEGLGVDFRETTAGLLASRWGEDKVEILNAGVVSYSPRLYHLKIRYLLDEVGLRFDRLVVFIDISDIQDELHYQSFLPVLEDPSASPSDNWWRRHSLSAQVIDQMVSSEKRVDNSFRTDADVNVWMEATDAYSNPDVDPEQGRWHWTVNDAIYDDWAAQGLELAEQQMQQLVDLCRTHGVEVTVVVYPAPVQIYAYDWDSLQVHFWKNFCERAELDFINLFPVFINDSFRGPNDVYQKYFIQSDVHWNETGHKLVAEIVGDHLQAALNLE